MVDHALGLHSTAAPESVANGFGIAVLEVLDHHEEHRRDCTPVFRGWHKTPVTLYSCRFQMTPAATPSISVSTCQSSFGSFDELCVVTVFALPLLVTVVTTTSASTNPPEYCPARWKNPARSTASASRLN